MINNKYVFPNKPIVLITEMSIENFASSDESKKQL